MASTKDFTVKNGLYVIANGSVQSTSTSTGAIVTPGGVGIGGNLNVGGISTFTGAISLNNKTSATSTTTGALVVSGGLGVGGSLVVGGNVLSTVYNVTATGATTVIDWSIANTVNLTLNTSTTLQFINTASTSLFDDMNFVIKQSATTASNIITWPSTVRWVSSQTAILSTATNAVDVLTLFTVDGGQNIYNLSSASMAGGAKTDLSNVLLPAGRTNLGTPKVVSLEVYAASAGITLQTGNDQPAFDAANTAISAASSGSGIYVYIPPGKSYIASSLKLANNGGYFATPRSVRINASRGSTSTATTYLVTNSTLYDCNYLFYGIDIDGGWSYGRGIYSGAPETDPWLDTQHGIYLYSDWTSGASYAQFVANSGNGSQEPHGVLANCVITRFGGDALIGQGSGTQLYRDIIIQNCGGKGINWNEYDSQLTNCDIGSCGRTGLYLGPNASSLIVNSVKTWFCGYRKLTYVNFVAETITDYHGCMLDHSGSNNIQINLQDHSGDALVLRGTNCSFNTINGICEWQGGSVGSPIPGLIAPVSALTTYGASYNRITLITDISNYAPQVSKLWRDLVWTDQSSYAVKNNIDIRSSGFPDDIGIMNWEWLDGPLDGTNDLKINGFRRSNAFFEDATGRNEVATMNWISGGISMGLVLSGDRSQYNKGAALLYADYVALQGIVNSGTPSVNTLTVTSNFSNGDTITIGSRTYTFRTAITATVADVAIGSSQVNSIINLSNAINRTNPLTNLSVGVPGTDYTTGTLAHNVVSVTSTSTNTLVITTLTKGVNNVSTTKVSTAATWTSTATVGGTNGSLAWTTGVAVDRYGNTTLGASGLSLNIITNTTVTNNVQSTSPTTGAFQVVGGVGIGGNINVGGTSVVASAATFNSTVGVQGNFNVTGTTILSNTATITSVFTASSTLTGALVIAGGVGVGRNVFIGGISSSPSSGVASSQALIVGAGGIGINGASYFANSVGIGATLNVSNNAQFGGATTVTNTTLATATNTAALFVAGGVGIGGNVWIGSGSFPAIYTSATTGFVGINTSSGLTYNLQVNGSFAATSKSFLIDHPTKVGMKLAYGSLEGPENGVYVRGKLLNDDVIQLPEYWTNLIDESSITVTLTPVGKFQNLYIKSVSNKKIVVGNSGRNSKIDCFYIVHAERRDIDKLVVER